jgi:hypothetical protein
MGDKSFLDRINEEVIVPVFAANEACRTCMFAHGEASWDAPEGYTITPDKCNCLIYDPDGLGDKPNDVAFHGAECEYYEKG